MIWLFKKIFRWGKPPAPCEHPAGYWAFQAIEAPIWDEATQQIRFGLVRKKFWLCPTCRQQLPDQSEVV